ncbi:MAG: YlbF family regulator [Clostridia bacterium]|nr:YlbF family regulator [Clostridia bacterium]
MENNNIDTKNVFELAIILGKALKEDPRLVKMEECRKAYEEDPELSRLMTEYNVQQKAIENLASAEEFDAQLIQSIQDRINELYEQITVNPVFVALNEAQEAVNELMNAVNNTITFAITGEMPSNCTHDCSTCGGCH